MYNNGDMTTSGGGWTLAYEMTLVPMQMVGILVPITTCGSFGNIY